MANEIFLSDVGIRKVVIGKQLMCYRIDQMRLFVEDTELCYLNLNNAQYIKVVKDLLLLLRYRVEVYEEVGGNFQLKAKVFVFFLPRIMVSFRAFWEIWSILKTLSRIAKNFWNCQHRCAYGLRAMISTRRLYISHEFENHYLSLILKR